jgi:epoxyqueuosine reductase
MEELSAKIKELAVQAGFDLVGISPVLQPAKSMYLQEWLRRKYHGTMHWMQTRSAVRKNIRLLFPQARAVISVGHNYYSPNTVKTDDQQAALSSYARIKDYHPVMKKKLKTLYTGIKKLDPELNGRICVDSAPLMEKLWAESAGIGWQGKHTVLISRSLGSWFFLGEIIIDRELTGDTPARNHCGTCQACLDACPTRALVQPYVLNASRCIAYLTIEYKRKQFPDELANKMGNWIFGCDICQRVCPWNKFSREVGGKDFAATKFSGYFTPAEWMKLSEKEFEAIFKDNTVRRTGYKKFMRNVWNAFENSRT